MPVTTLPFDLLPLSIDKPVIEPGSQGMPLPADLQPGDLLLLTQPDFNTRAFLCAANNDPSGTQVRLAVDRNSRLAHVTAQIVRVPRTLQNLLLQGAGIALTWLEADRNFQPLPDRSRSRWPLF